MSAAAVLETEDTPQGTVTLHISEPFDLQHAPDLRALLLRHIHAGHGPLLVDLSGTTVRDSTGFATLVSAPVRAARVGRSMRFSGADARTRRLLWRARLGRLLVD